MNKKLMLAGATAVVGLSAIAFSISTVSAYQGDYTKTGPNHTEERETAMEQVMASKDYEAWKKLMTEDGRSPGVLNKVDSQEDFEKFAEAYTLGKAGKTEEAAKIRAELGLGNGQGNGQGNGGTRGRGQNRSGSFVDANNDGVCDNLNQ